MCYSLYVQYHTIYTTEYGRIQERIQKRIEKRIGQRILHPAQAEVSMRKSICYVTGHSTFLMSG